MSALARDDTTFQDINFGNKLFTRLSAEAVISQTCSCYNIFCVVLKNVSGSLDFSFISVLDG